MSLIHVTEGSSYHVLFTFTPFNQILVQLLLREPEFSGQPTIVINTFYRDCLVDAAHVINFSTKNYGSLQAMGKYRAIAKTLADLRDSGHILSVTAPHPHNLLCNDLMLRRGTDYSVNVYEDGTANYCVSNNVGHLKTQSRRKRRLAPFLGFRYRDYAGHITGLDERKFDCGYFLSPNQVYRKERFHRLVGLEFSTWKSAATGGLLDRVLVLDQDIAKLYAPETVALLRSRLCKFVKELNMDVYLKSHPAQDGGMAPRFLGPSVKSVDGDVPAEFVALELRPKYVVSYVSSALKNIGAILPGVSCISFGVREFDSIRGTGLTEVFHDFNIEIR